MTDGVEVGDRLRICGTAVELYKKPSERIAARQLPSTQPGDTLFNEFRRTRVFEHG